MAELDQRHWWYRARREVLAALIRREARPPKGARLLEIGCGTGHNLAMLGEFGEVDALELDDEARAIAEKRLGRPVMSSPLPELRGRSRAALRPDRRVRRDRAYRRRPRRAGLDRQAPEARRQARHDRPRAPVDVVGARRRQPPQAALFEARRLRELFEGSPLQLEAIGYFNSLLFPLAVAERAGVEAVAARTTPTSSCRRRRSTTALERTFAAERHLVGRLPLPPGLSLFAVASAT